MLLRSKGFKPKTVGNGLGCVRGICITPLQSPSKAANQEQGSDSSGTVGDDLQERRPSQLSRCICSVSRCKVWVGSRALPRACTRQSTTVQHITAAQACTGDMARSSQGESRFALAPGPILPVQPASRFSFRGPSRSPLQLLLASLAQAATSDDRGLRWCCRYP